MIERYTLPEMGAVWTDEARMRAWLAVEIAAVKAWAKLGKVPAAAVADIEAKAAFDVARVNEIEQVTNHDVIAFLTNVAEHVGDSSKYIHYGMTSSDMLDTGLALQIKQAGELLQRDLRALGEVLKRRALELRDTVQVGRTHGVHAEPITFGMKLGIWAFETKRDLERLARVTDQAAVGKISGAVGAYNHIDPRVEELVCAELGIGFEPISSQVVQRDRHACFLSALAIVGAGIERQAVEVRHLQRTEVREAEEAFGKGQKGSSAMPHKRNPILSERMAGCARVLRGNAMAGMENVALWHERDISHSSAERIILPDSCILLDYMLQKWTKLMDGLVVDAGRMRANLDLSHRLVFSEAVLLALIDKGMLREDAYKVVQESAMRAWQEGLDFGGLIAANAGVQAVMTDEEIDAVLDPGRHAAGRDVIFARLEALELEGE
jgi:adenylosuccinate lyase